MADGGVQPMQSGLPGQDQVPPIIIRDQHPPGLDQHSPELDQNGTNQLINDEPLIDVGGISNQMHHVPNGYAHSEPPVRCQPHGTIGGGELNRLSHTSTARPGTSQEEPISMQPTGGGSPGIQITGPVEEYHSNWPNIYEDSDERPIMPRQPCGKTIIIQHPHNFRPIPKAPRQWSTGVCGCCQNPKMCAVFTFCCCCYDCWIAGELEETCCLPMIMSGPCATMALRIKLRTKYHIRGGILNDCLCSCFCYPCTACQLGREIRHIQKHPELILNLV